MGRKPFLLAVFVLAGSSVQAQWVPVTAKIRETKQILREGRVIQTHSREGAYYRRSDGAELREWARVDGDESKAVGYLTLHAEGITYDLTMINRRAMERRFAVPVGVDMRTPPKPPARPANLQRITIGGVDCTVVPSRTRAAADAPAVPDGDVCMADALNLMLRRQHSYRLPDGREVRTVFEMVEIQANVDPHPGLFDLKGRGFTIFRSTAN